MKHALRIAAVALLLFGHSVSAGEPDWKVETIPGRAAIKVYVRTERLARNEVIISAVCKVSFVDDKGNASKPEEFSLSKVPLLAHQLVSEEFKHSHGEKVKISNPVMEFEIKALGQDSLAP